MPEPNNAVTNIRDTGLSASDVSAEQVAACRDSITRAINTLIAQANENRPTTVTEIDGVDLQIDGVLFPE